MAWKHKMFEKVGMVLVNNAFGNRECLNNWLVKMEKLEWALSTKIDQTNDADNKHDLKIVRAKVLVLKQQVEKISHVQPISFRKTYRNASPTCRISRIDPSFRNKVSALASMPTNVRSTYRRNPVAHEDDESTLSG